MGDDQLVCCLMERHFYFRRDRGRIPKEEGVVTKAAERRPKTALSTPRQVLVQPSPSITIR